MKSKYTKENTDEFFKLLKSWLETDMVVAGFVYKYIEKGNPAFVRGYRSALHSVLRKAEEFFEENYIL